MDKELREIGMYGMTKADVLEEKPSFYSNEMWAVAILSDVQEIIAHEHGDWQEASRIFINKAKFWASKKYVEAEEAKSSAYHRRD